MNEIAEAEAALLKAVSAPDYIPVPPAEMLRRSGEARDRLEALYLNTSSDRTADCCFVDGVLIDDSLEIARLRAEVARLSRNVLEWNAIADTLGTTLAARNAELERWRESVNYYHSTVEYWDGKDHRVYSEFGRSIVLRASLTGAGD